MPGGRPTVWTPEVEEKVFEALNLGLSRRRAAFYAGVGESTMTQRLREDEQFSGRCDAEEAAGMAHHARNVRDAALMPSGSGSAAVQAAKFFLATRGEDAWVERKAVEHSGAIDLASAAAEVSSSIDEAMAAEDDD